MEDNKIIRIVLFNALVILTIVFIYLLLFPKQSYISKKLTADSNLLEQETFEENINNLKIAAETYFENNDKNKVTLKELIEKNLSAPLLDKLGNSCNTESYAEKQEEKMIIHLDCNEKSDTIEISKEKLLCIYQYKKELPETYTDWNEWSKWQQEKVEKTELVNVETKIEKESNGTKIITDTKEISENATEYKKNICPNGYEVEGSKCVKKTKLNEIKAYIDYTCPQGYSKNGLNCHKDGTSIPATKKYFCPDNQLYIKYELQGDKCSSYRTIYSDFTGTETHYKCKDGYKLKDNKCYKTIEYEHEVEDYKETTYYRYQTRKKQPSKYDIKWGKQNDKNLINDKYNIVGKVTCEI